MRKAGLLLVIVIALIGLSILSLSCLKLADAGGQRTGSKIRDGNLTDLIVLHTNDTHAALDNIAFRSTLIKKFRAEAGPENTLLLDSGDVFTGSIYFTVAQGEADLWFMQYLGYDAMGLGLHEFDKGPWILADFANRAGFPVLCANYDFTRERLLDGKILPWVVIQKGEERYGLFGLTLEPAGVLPGLGANIKFNDRFETAQQAVQELKQHGVNKIIALTHIGWENDIELAKKVEGIDIIIGGYSHVVPEVYPTVINEYEAPTLVVQAGTQGQYLGKIKVQFDREGVIKSWEDSQLVVVDRKIEPDPACTAKLEEYQEPIKKMLSDVVGETLVNLDGEKSRVRSQETNLGNLIADALLTKAATSGASIAIINGGSIRDSVPAGDFSFGQIMNILPFNYYLMIAELSGKQVIAALENGVSRVEEYSGRFPHVSGMRYTWDPRAKPGSRIALVEVKTPDGYRPIDLNARYIVATYDFLFAGGDGYTVFRESERFKNLGFTDYEVLREYVAAKSPVRTMVEGRIKRLGE